MCVNLTQYPLVELQNGKKKVLFNYGVVLENRDFTSLDSLKREWNLAKLGLVPKNNPDFNRAWKKYDIKNFIKYTCVPCGHCEECLKSRARGWAFRILKEAERYENNFFLTFTYDDDHLPYSDKGVNTLVKDAISDFNKRFKKKLHDLNLDSTFRFYGVGEYGSHTNRPHYHVIYFNMNIPDLEFYQYSSNGQIYFRSKLIESYWKNGQVIIGALDIGSACYVARYCDKKLDRTKEEKDLISNFCVPEFSVMSRRPGIGSYFMDSIVDNISNGIYQFYSNGNSFSIPLYYSKKVKDLLTPEALEAYETRNNNLMKVKFSRDLILSDILSTDLQHYYIKEDLYKKSCKKVRDNIKL